MTTRQISQFCNSQLFCVRIRSSIVLSYGRHILNSCIRGTICRITKHSSVDSNKQMCRWLPYICYAFWIFLLTQITKSLHARGVVKTGTAVSLYLMWTTYRRHSKKLYLHWNNESSANYGEYPPRNHFFHQRISEIIFFCILNGDSRSAGHQSYRLGAFYTNKCASPFRALKIQAPKFPFKVPVSLPISLYLLQPFLSKELNFEQTLWKQWGWGWGWGGSADFLFSNQ